MSTLKEDTLALVLVTTLCDPGLLFSFQPMRLHQMASGS